MASSTPTPRHPDTPTPAPSTPTPRHPSTPTPSPARRFTLPKSTHLRAKSDFDATFAAKTRESRGPLTVYAKPNDTGVPRLGLSVSRKVGTAVKRNRIRRLIREAFRLWRHDLPSAYDIVVVVRPHSPLMFAEYQKLLSATMVKLHGTWGKRT